MITAFYKSCLTCSEIFRPTYEGQACCSRHDREAKLARAAPIAAMVKPAASSIRIVREAVEVAAAREVRTRAGERTVTRFGKRKHQFGRSRQNGIKPAPTPPLNAGGTARQADRDSTNGDA